MKKAVFFVYFICLVVSGLSAQNWDINTLHRVNSWDGKFVRNYNKIISTFGALYCCRCSGGDGRCRLDKT